MKSYKTDKRIVMTLDAGGTKFHFSAIQAGKEIVKPIILYSEPNNLQASLENLVKGFKAVRERLPEPPAAISFAFPGPADYNKGIIGDLPNFPSFRGGVALGPFLEEAFKIPVYINNDGCLFAYGEAHTGVLPDLNMRLKAAGSQMQYRNLLGYTLGTGFGGGIVVNGQMHRGDSGGGGEIYPLPNFNYPGLIIEESVSIRAVKREYAKFSNDNTELTPKQIMEIADGTRLGNKEAAIASFAKLGEAAGTAIATALTLIDGIVVIGGGLTGAAKYIMPAMLEVLRGPIKMWDGTTFGRVPMKVYYLDDPQDFEEFAKGSSKEITVPNSSRKITYDPIRRAGVAISNQGASRSIIMGAYAYALHQLDNKKTSKL